MTESGDDTTRLRPETTPLPPEQLRRRNRRRRCACWICCPLLAFLLLVGALVLILALTVFKPRDPKMTIVSAKVEGVMPRVNLPAGPVELNVTLDLELLVYNPNRASFAHAPGTTVLYYRSNQVGDADVAPGRIPSRGSERVHSRLTLEADRFAADLGTLLRDVLAGEVAIDTATRIPGRVTFLGFVKRHAVAFSDCHVVIGFPDLSVRDQQCRQKTKL